MSTVRCLHRGWQPALIDLVKGAERELVIAAPFITAEGTQVIAGHLSSAVLTQGRVELVTDLSPTHVCDGSLDTDALAELANSHACCSIWHVPALHAKVYLADSRVAIVTSANLTAGGFYRNAEYGVEIHDRQLVKRIRSDVADLQSLGASIATDSLQRYADVASAVRKTFAARRSSVDPKLQDSFDQAVRAAEDALIRVRLQGGAMHTVFAKTITLLLARHGPMQTTAIHSRIQQLHPDLCDDTIDRVIDGENFGKKWKHAVRTAQQNLRKLGVIELSDGVWSLVAPRQEAV